MVVLIIGLGSIAKKHIKAIQIMNPSAYFLAMRNSVEAETVEGVTNIYQWTEVLVPPDFVIISNPTKMHKKTISEALTLNRPLFIEKPVVKTWSEANALLTETEIQHCPTYVACNLRFHPCLLFLKEQLATSHIKINEVNVYCGSDLSKWRPGQDYKKSYSASAELGGGVHLDLIHEVDYCYWLFGKPQEVISIKRKVSQLEIDSIDFAVYHLLYPGFTVNIILNYYRQDAKREIEIITADCTLQANLLEAVVVKNGVAVFKSEEFRMENTYLQQMNYFIDHIQTKQPMMNNFSEAAEVLKIATA